MGEMVLNREEGQLRILQQGPRWVKVGAHQQKEIKYSLLNGHTDKLWKQGAIKNSLPIIAWKKTLRK